jgi:dihydrofolate synthase/folylpolyglutamate synthase
MAMNGRSAIEYLLGLEMFGMRLGLENVTELLDRMGNPHREWKAVHVAGTNGKGSVCAFVSSVLQEAGYKSGLYTSPHLVDLNERIRVNGELIADDRLEELAARTRVVSEDMASVSPEKQITFFEFLTALAFHHFHENDIDIGVLEVGLGGRLDATNVVVPEVSAITHLAVEHTEHLGNTLEQIAGEKAGIIKDGVPVVVSDNPALKAIAEACNERQSDMIVVGKDIEYDRTSYGLDGQRLRVKGDSEHEIEIGLLGMYQIRNAATAYGILEVLRRKGYEIPDKAISKGFSSTTWPGRFQIVRRNPFLVIDTAHNPDAALELRKTVEEVLQYDKSILVLGMLNDKDLKAFGKTLVPIADTVLATESKSSRAFPAGEIAEEMQNHAENVEVVPNVAEALKKAMSVSGKNDLICVTGSNTMVGEALQYLDKVK